MINKIYGLDTRSISAFRILLSVFIAGEFILLVLGNFNDIYSPETGVLGNCFAEGYQSNYKNFSALFSIQTDGIMQVFVGSIILTMLLVAVGFYSQFFALVGCILLWLFFSRYQLLYFGWEMYASVMLFWLIAKSCEIDHLRPV